MRESRGEAWRRPGHRARRGGQASRERGGVVRWRARAGHTPLPLSGRRRQRREAAGPPAGWAGQLAGPDREEPR